MLIPVRCFSCGKPVSDSYPEYVERTTAVEKGGKGEPTKKALDDLGITRVCCRRMMLGNVDLIDEILPYPRF